MTRYFPLYLYTDILSHTSLNDLRQLLYQFFKKCKSL